MKNQNQNPKGTNRLTKRALLSSLPSSRMTGHIWNPKRVLAELADRWASKRMERKGTSAASLMPPYPTPIGWLVTGRMCPSSSLASYEMQRRSGQKRLANPLSNGQRQQGQGCVSLGLAFNHLITFPGT